MEVIPLLANSFAPDAALRAAAEQQLASYASTQYSAYMVALAAALANEHNAPPGTRAAAGLALKNSIQARDSSRKDEYETRWRALDEQMRSEVKQNTLATLASVDRQARNAAGQVVATIASVEIPLGWWQDLIGTLLDYVKRDDNANLRQATLQAIGFICEQIRPELLATQSNQILTAVVQGARKEEPSADVQLAAVNALYNSLEFVSDNFQRDGERNYIMQIVCEATQSTSSDVQVAAYACLVRIMQLYYDKMKFYMERALFGLTVLGMKSGNDQVALQALEFWSTVCDEEIDLALQHDDAAEYDEGPERESMHFARIALPEILPVVLQLLAKQDEDASEDEWDVSMAAGTCLALLAQCVGDSIVAPIIPYVEGNIKSTDWHHREAAVMAFGSILDGPDAKMLAPLVAQALPTLIEMIHDPEVHVKDTAAWTLGRISDLLVQTIKPDTHLPNMVAALMQGLTDSSRVATNCCWSFMNLAEQICDMSAETSVLSPYFESIVNALLQYATRSEPNAKTSGYEACSTLVAQAPEDCLTVVLKVANAVLERAENALRMQDQLLGTDDRHNYDEQQVNLCGLLASIVRRLSSGVQPLADRIMTLLLGLVSTSGKQSPILEDAFLCIGALTSALESRFSPYLEHFLPSLHQALSSYEEYQLCSIAVGLIGDICRALSAASAPYCSNFMQLLLAALQSTVLHRSVKPPILSCFGDIAMAIGAGFEPFLPTVMNVLHQAGAMRADPQSSYELIEYINSLREGILEAYTGVMSGLKQAGKADLMLPYTNTLFVFLHLCLTDQDRTEAVIRPAIGLLGDLADAFGAQLKAPLSQEWVGDAFRVARARTYQSQELKKVVRWSKEMVRRACA